MAYGSMKIPLVVQNGKPYEGVFEAFRNGIMERQYFVVTGGPYRDRPSTMRGVKMAAEIDKPYDVSIPTHDFHTPDRKQMYRGLNKAIDMMLRGDPLYVGCMGGIGRTGLFLAVLVKAFGVRDPVKYVRTHYIPHAVETPQQQDYIKKLTITPTIRMKIKTYRQKSWKRFWKTNLTQKSI